jgi:hypothetical protein
MMCVEIPEVRVGWPLQCGAAQVFPLFVAAESNLAYVLSDEAVAQGMVTVQEVSESGVIQNLLVDNGGDQPVLFLEGTEIRGGKQARVLNTSVLVAGGRTVIPVTCVERKRWKLTSPNMAVGSHCPPSLRFLLKGKHSAAQVAMWKAICRKHQAMGVRSTTHNLSDALDCRRGEMEELRAKLPCPEGPSGIAVALSGQVVCVDLFDKSKTCQEVWERFVEGVVLDALEKPAGADQASDAEVLTHLYRLRDMRWQRVDSVGLGEQYLSSPDGNAAASALVVDGRLVHASVAAHIYKE